MSFSEYTPSVHRSLQQWLKAQAHLRFDDISALEGGSHAHSTAWCILGSGSGLPVWRHAPSQGPAVRRPPSPCVPPLRCIAAAPQHVPPPDMLTLPLLLLLPLASHGGNTAVSM